MKKIKKELPNDPFLLRAIEHWLDSLNELTYQPLFCMWLISKGHNFKYFIKNTNFEFWKDVVSIWTDWIPCAYQLKWWKITLTRWRSEVKPEIEALIDCPISHPDISKEINHKSYLVTNWEIDDSVREEIMSLNSKKWKNTPLNIMTRSDLLFAFQEMASWILPRDALSYKLLVNLIFSNWDDLPNLETINLFLIQVLKISEWAGSNKESIKRDITASLLYCYMILGPYRNTKNYVGVIHILTLLISNIFYLVEKIWLEEKYWLETYNIIYADIIVSAKELEKELTDAQFEIRTNSPLEKDLVIFRKNVAILSLFSFKLAQIINKEFELKDIIDATSKWFLNWSIPVIWEWQLLWLVLYSFILRRNKLNDLSKWMLKEAVSIIISNNWRKSENKLGLLSPYCDFNFLVNFKFWTLEEEYDYSSHLSSYLLNPIINILAKSWERSFLEENWKEISFMHFEEFIFENTEDIFLYHNKKWENRTFTPNKEQSWKDLVDRAGDKTWETLPKTLLNHLEFLPFFLAVFPFRANSNTLSLLDEITF